MIQSGLLWFSVSSHPVTSILHGSVSVPSLSSSLVAKHPKIQWLETSERTVAHIPGLASCLGLME